MAPAQKKQKLANGAVAIVDAVDGDNPPVQKSQQSKPEQRRSLFIRALPPTATTETLTELFSESYPIKHATAVTNPDTQECKGYGFVTFADAEDAQRAKEEFNGHVLDGRKLRVELAEPRQREDGKSGDAEKGTKKALEKPAKAQPLPCRLIVRNLPWTIKNESQLTKLFLSFGKVKQAYIPRKGGAGGLSSGFGFVVMRGRKNAEKALESVNGKEVDGRTLAVDWAVDKETYESLTKQDTNEDVEEDFGNGALDEEKDEDDEDDIEVDDDRWSNEDEDVEDDEEEEGHDAEDDIDIEVDGEKVTENDKTDDRSNTLFVRNLPFTCTDEDLEDHFATFGSTRYARVVMDYETGRSKGTGFICFYNQDDANACIRGAPRKPVLSQAEKAKESQVHNSLLQNDATDPSGQYTLDGRVLQVSRAVNKQEASRLSEDGVAHRSKRDKDKRRLYLLSEGTIRTDSQMWDLLAPSERTMREASAKQRKTLIESNPSLHMSLTRLSIRNIPRSVGSKELKALAREAIVGFATEVKGGKRHRLSKEELARGGDEMVAAEAARKKAGKGVVRQAKVVFEGAGGSKVSEETGAGRSRGYGFIEYYTHRSALMGLRWLNGHAVGYQVKNNEASKKTKPSIGKDEMQDRKKRLIVEFAIENAQVVQRRNEKEAKARERSNARTAELAAEGKTGSGNKPVKFGKNNKGDKDYGKNGKKRKRGLADQQSSEKSVKEIKIDEKTAKRNAIIGRKRAMRKSRKG
nr:putative rna-binding protein c4f6.14 [Quercus suber]